LIPLTGLTFPVKPVALGACVLPSRKDAVTAYVLLLPLLILFGTFTIYPFFYGFFISLYNWDGYGAGKFIGLGNYFRALTDRALYDAAAHNVQYAAGTVTGKLLFSFLMALLMQRSFKGVTFFRAVFFVPVVLSTTTTGVLWARIYDPVLGLLDNFLIKTGIISEPILWLGEPKLAIWSLVIVDLWKWIGYHTVIFLAGLTTIPDELYESASIDGANTVQKLFFITIPQLRDIVLMNLTIALMGAFSVFDIVYIMTKGGPYKSTEVILTYMYNQTFGSGSTNYGYGSTIAMLLFFIILCITIVMTKIMNRED
jgi:ABC-type sugar transport system permease subunit